MTADRRPRSSDNALAIEAMLGRVKAERDALPPDTVVGGFVLREVLQRDDISVLYSAAASASGAAVCIEEYLPSSLAVRAGDRQLRVRLSADQPAFDAGAQAFRREAEQLGAELHPALLRIGPLWQANGTWYRLVPWHDGITLAAWRQGRSAPPPETDLRSWLTTVLEVLQTLHAAGQLHGDVRPGKLWLRSDHSVQLGDFGAARTAVAAASAGRVDWPEIECRPPELADDLVRPSNAPLVAGLPRPGPWSDLYALAATVFHAATGVAPVAASLRTEGQPAPTFAQATGNLQHRGLGTPYGEGLVRAVDAALQLDPAARPQTVAAFIALLDAPAVVPVTAEAPPASPVDLRSDPSFTAETAALGRFGADPGNREPVWSFDDVAVAPRDGTAPERLDPAQRAKLVMAAIQSRGETPMPRVRPVAAPRWRWAFGGAVAGALLTGAAVFLWLGPDAGSPTARSDGAPAATDGTAALPPNGSLSAERQTGQSPAPATSSAAAAAAAQAAQVARELAMAAPPQPAAARNTPASAAVGASEASRAAPLPDRAASAVAGPAPQSEGRPAPGLATSPAPEPPMITEAAEPPVTVAGRPTGDGVQTGRAAQGAPAAAPARPPVAVAANALPSSPSGACAPRTNFSLYNCMQTQCRQERFFSHPECIRLRVSDETP